MRPSPNPSPNNTSSTVQIHQPSISPCPNSHTIPPVPILYRLLAQPTTKLDSSLSTADQLRAKPTASRQPHIHPKPTNPSSRSDHWTSLPRACHARAGKCGRNSDPSVCKEFSLRHLSLTARNKVSSLKPVLCARVARPVSLPFNINVVGVDD